MRSRCCTCIATCGVLVSASPVMAFLQAPSIGSFSSTSSVWSCASKPHQSTTAEPLTRHYVASKRIFDGPGVTKGASRTTTTTAPTKPSKPSRVRSVSTSSSASPPPTFDPVSDVIDTDGGVMDGAVLASTGHAGAAATTTDNNNTTYKLLLVGVALIWGSNFGALKYLDTCGVDVSILTTLRFLLASIALLPALRGKSMDLIKAGLEVGLFISLGYITQAIGLQTTSASSSAFICSLQVVVVPLIGGLLGRKIPAATWSAALLALMGVGLLTLQGTEGPSWGDLWSLGQPIGFGLSYIRIEHYMKKFKGQGVSLAAAQMLSVLFCSVLWSAYNTAGFSHLPDFSILTDPAHTLALLYTGLVTSALAVVLQSVALEHVPATEAAVIFSTEPLWASLTAALTLGERLAPAGYAGGAAILVACLLAQLDISAFLALLPPLAQLASEEAQKFD